MQTQIHPLLAASLGSQKQLHSWHFGPADVDADATANAQTRPPKVYIQASLHADELPGMLVAHHLHALLAAAEARGDVQSPVVVVPVANPIGLGQRLNHKFHGRFEWDSAENFNRHYPPLADAVIDAVAPRLGADPAANVAVVRAAVGDYLRHWPVTTELQSLRRQLLLLAHDADVVLDLHCDSESALHLYSEADCWPPLEPLARLLGCRAVLLAHGGISFDECLSGLWWQLSEQLSQRCQALNQPAPPLPQACASATVELRGQADVSHPLAQADAQAIFHYLEHLGVLRTPKTTDKAPTLPALACTPTPLAGSETLHSPRPGVLVFHAQPGQDLQVGDAVADVIDPLTQHVHVVRAGVAGVFYARVTERYVHAGGEIGKIAGAIAFRSGNLLGA